MARFLDLNHPFFIPLWRRVLITAICLGWAIFEIVMGSPFWAILFGALGLYAGYVWFFDFRPRDPETKP
jgi:hypothetical protein